MTALVKKWFVVLVLGALTAGCGPMDPCASVPCSPGRVCVMKGSAVSPKVTCEAPDGGQ
jgi:hypothetical protein